MNSETTERLIGAQVSRRALLGSGLGLLILPALGGCTGSRGASAPAATGAPTVVTPAATHAAPDLGPMRINWNAVSGSMSEIWMADATGAWREQGIEPQLSNIPSSSQVLPALLADDLDGTTLDVLVGVRGIAGGADLVFVAGITNRQMFSVFTRPEIGQPTDLAGQQWGITRVGASTDVASHLALEQWGLDDAGITFVQLGTVANILAALDSGQIAAGTLSPPTSFRAQALGLKEMINLAENGPELPSVALATMRHLMEDRSELIQAFVKGYALGVKRFMNDEDRAKAVYREYLRTDDPEIINQTYALYKRYLAWPPVIPTVGLERVRREVAREEASAADMPLDRVYDNRFVEQLRAEEFFG
jgi:ABC-type nitrate/sulfonate/bicarbonate transport system substrate-binding protein